MTERGTLTGVQVCRLVNVTYRQLDHWVRAGYLSSRHHDLGSGHQRRFTVQECVEVALLAVLPLPAVANPGAARGARLTEALVREALRQLRFGSGSWLVITGGVVHRGVAETPIREAAVVIHLAELERSVRESPKLAALLAAR